MRNTFEDGFEEAKSRMIGILEAVQTPEVKDKDSFAGSIFALAHEYVHSYRDAVIESVKNLRPLK